MLRFANTASRNDLKGPFFSLRLWALVGNGSVVPPVVPRRWVCRVPLHDRPESSETLADGLIHRELTLEEGPWVVHVLELDLDLTRGGLEIRSVHALDKVHGRERTSDIARRIQDSLGGVLGAINADFFSPDGETIGNQVIQGELVRGTPERSVRSDGVLRHRSHFGITAGGRPVIMRPELKARVSVDGRSWESISGVNVPNRGGLVLFNRYWGEQHAR